jgi:hypothetical protein
LTARPARFNLRLAINRFLEKLAPLSNKSVEEVRREMGDLRFSRSDEMRAVVDMASGRVTNMHTVSTMEARAGGQGISRIETITLTRTLPTRRA